MSNQLIITVGREFGSGGHAIAEMLAKKFGLTLYDSNILKEIAIHKNIDHEEIERYDEIPKNRLFSRTRRGYSNSIEENIAHMQFCYLREKAEEGKSFVVVGRCSETILKGYPGVVSIFVLADRPCKVERISKLHNISSVEADVMINQQDKKRKSYHNYYCPIKWGDSRNYDMCINSSRLGIEGTADMLEKYIKERMLHDIQE
jgi:cytidylate kinase